MWNVLVFALIGLFVGTAARMFYRGREPRQVMETLGLGLAGGIIGGLFSWIFWPFVEGQFQSGNLLLSILGAMLTLGVWTGVAAYKLSLGGNRNVAK
jgi:uncharacterized membrane protein YeaQ/YmgE (transglycosylase-associated protein family)